MKVKQDPDDVDAAPDSNRRRAKNVATRQLKRLDLVETRAITDVEMLNTKLVFKAHKTPITKPMKKRKAETMNDDNTPIVGFWNGELTPEEIEQELKEEKKNDGPFEDDWGLNQYGLPSIITLVSRLRYVSLPC